MDEQQAVAEIRRRAGLTQQQLADRSGVAQPNIAAYEKGSRRPSSAMLRRLTDAARTRPSLLLAAKRDEIMAVAARHHVVDIRVFGSVARGEDVPTSDLDLLVTFAPRASLFDQASLVDDLEDLLGVQVDVISTGGLRSGHDAIKTESRAL